MWLLLVALAQREIASAILAIVLMAICFLIYIQVAYAKSIEKKFLLKTYLQPASIAHKLFSGTRLLRLRAALVSIALSLVAYIEIYSLSQLECLVVTIAIAIGMFAHQFAFSLIESMISIDLRPVVKNRSKKWLGCLSVFIALLALRVIRGVRVTFSECTSDQLVTLVISEINHPVRWIRHCVRTLRYAELQSYRIRDIIGFPFGWIIFIYFAIPSGLTSYALTNLYLGIEKLISKRKDQPKSNP